VSEGDVQNIVKKQVLIELAKNMGITEQQITTMFALKKAKTTSKQIKTLRSLIAQKRRRTQTNSGDCNETFEQITEAQLLSYLQAGWQIVKELQSGDIIVKR
jgi:protein-disulfide isomerase-like protein with CxxC motif